jgi:hypothetical protein
MAVSAWLAQRNEKARARLMRNLPEIFPGAVLLQRRASAGALALMGLEITSDNIPLSEPTSLRTGRHSSPLSRSERERFPLDNSFRSRC